MKLIKIFLLLFLAVKVFAADPMDFNDKFREHSKKFSDNNSSEKQNDKLQKSTDDKMNEKLSATKLEKNTTKDLKKNSLTDINSKMTESLNRKPEPQLLKKKYKKGYVEIKKKENYYHINVPFSSSPENKLPLLIGLHRESGTGAELLPQLQLNIDQDALIVCPDSINHFTWVSYGKELSDNIDIIEESIKIMRKHYYVDDSKIFLVAHGAGGVFALRMLCDKINNAKIDRVLSEFSGVIISGAEAKVEYENEIWPLSFNTDKERGTYKNFNYKSFESETANLGRIERGKAGFYKPDIFLFASTIEYPVPISSVRFTKEILRNNGYNVNYIEGAWEGYPVGYNKVILDWCNNEDRQYTDFKEKVEKNSTGVTNQVKIYEIMRTKADPDELVKIFKSSIRKNTSTNANTDVIRYKLVDSRYTFMVKVPMSTAKLDAKKLYNDIKVVFLAFNENKEIVGGDEWRFAGLDPGDKQISTYLKERYASIAHKRDEMLEKENSLRRNEKVAFQGITPFKSNDEYACVMVYKGGFLAGLRMYPDGTDHSEFPDLEHIVLKNDY